MKQERFSTIAVAILALAMALDVGLLGWTQYAMDRAIVEAEEASKPAEIELTLIAPDDCEECIDGKLLLAEIEKEDVRVIASERLTSSSQEGVVVIDAYAITRLPAVIVKGEYDKENVASVFETLAGAVRGDALVIEVQQPVYVDVATGDVIGLVDVTYITDSRCADCYDPVAHKTILQNAFGMTIDHEEMVDARSSYGMDLIETYNITQTPTVLLSSSANAYAKLLQVWQTVGTVEADGTFVFRKSASMGNVTYYDIETGMIIRPETQD